MADAWPIRCDAHPTTVGLGFCLGDRVEDAQIESRDGGSIRLPRVRLNQFAYAKLLARKVGGRCGGWSQSIRKNRRFTAGFCHDRNALSPCPRAPFPISHFSMVVVSSASPHCLAPPDRSCCQAEPDRTRSTGHSAPLLAEFAVQVFVNLETTDLATTRRDGQRDGNWTQCTAGLTDSRFAVKMLRPVGRPGNTRNPNTRILQCRSVVCCLHASAHQITRQVPDATSLLLASGCDSDRRPIFQRVRLPSFAIPIQLCFHDTPKVPKFLPPPPAHGFSRLDNPEDANRNAENLCQLCRVHKPTENPEVLGSGRFRDAATIHL